MSVLQQIRRVFFDKPINEYAPPLFVQMLGAFVVAPVFQLLDVPEALFYLLIIH